MTLLNNPLLEKPKKPFPKTVAIVGAGTIGPDIGYYLKSNINPLNLVLIDLSESALEKATNRILKYADKGLDRGKLSQTQARAVKENIIATQDYDALASAEWVIEAATEDLDLKRKIFTEVEARVSSTALITSNTSSLPAERIYRDLRNPERATVTHFFAPAFTNPIVEVINWDKLDSENLAYLRYLFAATGKVPMVTRDVVCFMLDRIFDNWCNEAGHLLRDGTAAQIDSVAQKWVHAGPFFVLNLANGNPIIIETNQLQAEEEGSHYDPVAAFHSPDRWQTIKPGEQVDVPKKLAAKIDTRLLGILFSQALEILDRDIGVDADLELGSRLAFGFRKGPLELIQEDPERAQACLQTLSKERPGMPMPKSTLADYTNGPRFVLCDDVDGVKVITLRRPEALNAINDDINDEILAILQQYESDADTKGFVLTGYGRRAFCAGGDIGRFPAMLGDANASTEYARACSRLLVHLDEMEKPVVAALNGMTLGGGLELAIRCHGLVAVDDVRIQLPEITLGIVPGIGAMVVPFRRWPDAASTFMDMLCTARPIDGKQAMGTGMLDEIVKSPDELLPAAIRLVRDLDISNRRPTDSSVALSSGSAQSSAQDAKAFDGRVLSESVLSILRTCVVEAAKANSYADALEIGYRAFGETACTEAAKEGVIGFLEGRKPDFEKTG